MTLNMDDDLDMSMRAPYISMNESSELPLLIAEDLMWGAQPDLKQTLNINKKPEITISNQQQQQTSDQLENVNSPTATTATTVKQAYPQIIGKNSMESSLASLLCSQLLQHHQQQIQEQQQQQQHQQQSKQQVISLNQEVKIKILDQGELQLVNPNTLTIQGQGLKIGKYFQTHMREL